MRKLLLLAWLASQLSAQHSFTIGTGNTTFAPGVSKTVGNTITVTVNGAPTSGVSERGFVYITMGGKVKSSLPPGMTGSCTGDPCIVVTGISVNGVSSSTGFPSTDNNGNAFAVEPVFSLNSAG